ncbi:hypothetical protein CERSUDRAFT_94757 [Gelatoporia subvermispora B]|uniref:Helicase ATP-binding domain-containing protein n=1 Tax=Ceriporiopsis subvermispora (strain B) TaxID=914234 RepID=M2QZT7_CERS8|nr:hypothetical protein CERSUDRAFT_94757 [Gelatoporia subvermispora B]
MPAFQKPHITSLKRKSDASDLDDATNKRQALGSETAAKAAYQRGHEQYWMVQWRNPQYKKNKHWEGDAVLVVCGTVCKLYDTDGKEFSSGKAHGIDGTHRISEGVNFSVGSKELEVEYAVKREDFLSGKCFGRGVSSNASTSLGSTSASAKQFKPLRPVVVNTPSFIAPPPAPNPKHTGIQLEAVNLTSSKKSATVEAAGGASFWTVNWRKPQQKKHKTWDGDGYIAVRDNMLLFIDDRGIVLGKKKWDRIPLYAGYRTFLSGKDVELNCEISEDEIPVIQGTSTEPDFDADIEPPPSLQVASRVLPQTHHENGSPVSVNSPSAIKKFIPPSSFYGQPPPKLKSKGPLHDPSAEGAIVMKAPTDKQMTKIWRKSGPSVPVVVDPVLGRRLRPHQVEGVKFMYECVMGMGEHDGQGCILADEMGMGKTLQVKPSMLLPPYVNQTSRNQPPKTITLIWTLLKQNPCSGAGPTVSKVLIVCPVTLITNWKNEFHKWLGKDRVGVFTGDKDKKTIKQFNNSRTHQVLVIGYERLRTVIDDLAYCQPPIDLIICDEGHRLKSANNKTSAMFKALDSKRRIILSGTPIQNDLSEFHAMADFCNPGLLDSYPNFRRLYETPILKSRAPGCSSEEKEIGEARSAQLMSVARSFVLRRDASTLKKYLPPKHEYVVFITPTKLQLSIFQTMLAADKLDNLIRGSTAESLALINMMTKISNSPILLKATADHAKNKADAAGDVTRRHAIQEALDLLPVNARVEDVSLSGKLTALAKLLKALRKPRPTINGSHPSVCLYCNSSAELLVYSLQSDGQKRPVFIYRFLTTGTIDEKIYQRQVTKIGLSDSLMGTGASDSKSDSFTHKDLRDIFTVYPHTPCHTHDLLECQCEASDHVASMGMQDAQDTMSDEDDDDNSDEDPPQHFVVASHLKADHTSKADRAYRKRKKEQLAALGQWTHINCLRPDARTKIQDELLARIVSPVNEKEPDALGGQSRVDALLQAVDLENVLSNANAADQVPGGTVSFLFERSSRTQMVEEGNHS